MHYNGIQLKKGKNKGRLIIPCDHIEAKTKHYYSHIIYSDDGGINWNLGGSTSQNQVNEFIEDYLAAHKKIYPYTNQDAVNFVLSNTQKQNYLKMGV